MAPPLPSKQELADYLEQLEQARARDHRKLGKELKLFHIEEAVGSHGAVDTQGSIIRQALQDFIMDEPRKTGYEQVFTPHIGKLDLFRTSGHFPYYKDSQFPIVEPGTLENMAENAFTCAEFSQQLESGAVDGFLLRPMNCPMHIKIFDSQPTPTVICQYA